MVPVVEEVGDWVFEGLVAGVGSGLSGADGGGGVSHEGPERDRGCPFDGGQCAVWALGDGGFGDGGGEGEAAEGEEVGVDKGSAASGVFC